MRVLLFSMILYLAGIAAVLFVRPELMFFRDGRWKEFSVADEEGTVFPFWLFCIVWAVASYLVVRVIVSEPAAVVSAMAVSAAPLREEYGEGEPVMRPGYYRLNAAHSKKGVPKYVYIGPEEPEA
jgi:hypothetical protein